MTDIDTGVAVVPATRPSTFSPPNYVNGIMLNRPLASVDTGVATNPAPLANTVDDILGITVVASPGV